MLFFGVACGSVVKLDDEEVKKTLGFPPILADIVLWDTSLWCLKNIDHGLNVILGIFQKCWITNSDKPQPSEMITMEWDPAQLETIREAFLMSLDPVLITSSGHRF